VAFSRQPRAAGPKPETAPPERSKDDMANIKSQIKRNRQNERRRERNKAVRSEMRTRTKSAVRAAEEGAGDLAERLREAVRRIDKAAAKGVIHPNQAARRKSRLARHIARLAEENSAD
jgi:small subunit ribosomal protein S20